MADGKNLKKVLGQRKPGVLRRASDDILHTVLYEVYKPIYDAICLFGPSYEMLYGPE
jgi:hypothetical protein